MQRVPPGDSKLSLLYNPLPAPQLLVKVRAAVAMQPVWRAILSTGSPRQGRKRSSSCRRSAWFLSYPS